MLVCKIEFFKIDEQFQNFSNRAIELTGFLYSDYSSSSRPSLLGIKKPDDNDSDRVNLNKIYGAAVNIKREDQVPITIAVLCRDDL